MDEQPRALQPLIDITHTLTPQERRAFAADYAAADTEEGLTVDEAMAYYRKNLKRTGSHHSLTYVIVT